MDNNDIKAPPSPMRPMLSPRASPQELSFEQHPGDLGLHTASTAIQHKIFFFLKQKLINTEGGQKNQILHLPLTALKVR